MKSLVEMHGGAIGAASEGPNQGSVFSVRLPVLVETPAEEAVLDGGLEDRADVIKRRVLVVDDNKAAATTLSLAVKMLGHDVRTASDGQEAIEAAADFQPEAILMDIGMPKMNGYEAAKHIRRQAWGAQIMMIALTGWGQDDDKRRRMAAGFNHLVKPADPAELRKLLTAGRRQD